VCIDPHQTGFVGKDSDHLQLIKFWPSRAPGRGCGRCVAGRKILAPPYYNQFASHLSAFSFLILISEGFVPQEWKIANITPLFKKKDHGLNQEITDQSV